MNTDPQREFLFNYRFDGAEWGITIFATNSAEAREKIKAVALARYEGEVYHRFRIPGGRILERFMPWKRRSKR